MITDLRGWLHRRRNPERFALLERLLGNQALSREQLLRKRQEDLAAIVAFAAANTDYYAQRFARIRGIDDGEVAIGDLPILTKEDVTARLDAMLARGADRSQSHLGHTGGSTGKPLAFYWDAAKHELMRAGMMRSYMGSGWQPGQRILNLWGAAQDIRGGGFARKFGEYVTGEKTLGARAHDERQLREWADLVRAWRPVLLQGYASILAGLARFVIDNRLEMPRTLLGVYSTAEVLGEEQRELMMRAFSCPVFNQYGSREIPNIACECRHGNMHVFTDMVWLESERRDGEDDRLLVTSLTNRLMPMIRYDIGDSGRLKDGGCDCGWPFPLMEMGMCRRNDLIRTPAGKVIHPSYFNGLLYGMSQIGSYQFVQRDPGRIVLSLVATSPLPPETVSRLQDRIHRDIAAGVKLEINYVDAIRCTASGKHRFVISEVA